MSDNDGVTEPEVNLALQLMGGMLNAAHETGQTLIDLKDKEIAKLRAELNLIRDNMEYILNQPWTPSTRTLLTALYPDKESVERAVENGMGEWEYARR